MAETIEIDVWSDIACPWCYVGKRKLEAGIAAFRESHPDVDVAVEFHSFELAPDTPVDFEGSEVDFLVRHKGISAEQVKAMLAQVSTVAAEVGLDYDFGALRHTKTLAAHQLLHHAKAQGKQAAMKERLMRAYFTEGRHVGRLEELADLAADVGLDRDRALRSLREEAHREDVEADINTALQLGIRAVPFFVFEKRLAVAGAQPPETFVRALEQVHDEAGRSSSSRSPAAG